jgi:hypothetical protein
MIFLIKTMRRVQILQKAQRHAKHHANMPVVKVKIMAKAIVVNHHQMVRAK